jgi:hypothetical protein
LDLIRTLLIELESAPFEHGWVDLELEGYSPDQVSYHVRILADQGLIEAVDLSTKDKDWPDWRPKRLTAQGHSFLDEIRSDTVWNKVKARLGSEMATSSFAIVKALARDQALKLFGIDQ